MKKIFIISVLMFTSIAVFGQAFNAATAKRQAVDYIRLSLVCPSSFKLKNRFGNNISFNQVICNYYKEDVVLDSVVNTRYVITTDSVRYLIDEENNVLDSVVWESSKTFKDVSYRKIVYPARYIVMFYYEASNRMGGRVQESAHLFFYKNYGICENSKEEITVLNKKVRKDFVEKPVKRDTVSFPKAVYFMFKSEPFIRCSKWVDFKSVKETPTEYGYYALKTEDNTGWYYLVKDAVFIHNKRVPISTYLGSRRKPLLSEPSKDNSKKNKKSKKRSTRIDDVY